MNSRVSYGFGRFELVFAVFIIALSAVVAYFGMVRFHYGALGFTGLLVASAVALGLLMLAVCVLLGVVDVLFHKHRMRMKARKGSLPDGK
jgi:hypothetical protein